MKLDQKSIGVITLIDNKSNFQHCQKVSYNTLQFMKNKLI